MPRGGSETTSSSAPTQMIPRWYLRISIDRRFGNYSGEDIAPAFSPRLSSSTDVAEDRSCDPSKGAALSICGNSGDFLSGRHRQIPATLKRQLSAATRSEKNVLQESSRHASG